MLWTTIISYDAISNIATSAVVTNENEWVSMDIYIKDSFDPRTNDAKSGS